MLPNLQLRLANTARFMRPVTLNPSNVPAHDISTQSFTVKGLQRDMFILVKAPSLENGLLLNEAKIYCTATDTLQVQFENITALDINPASQQFWILAL